MLFQGEYLRILLLIRSGDVETNPGPKKQSYLKTFHWNLNGLAAHDFVKVQLIEVYIATNNFYTLCLSETFQYSSISNGDNRIKHVSIYYKDFLPLIEKDNITDVKECLVTEKTVCNEKCFFTCLFRSPSQNCDQFRDFRKDFGTVLNNLND